MSKYVESADTFSLLCRQHTTVNDIPPSSPQQHLPLQHDARASARAAVKPGSSLDALRRNVSQTSMAGASPLKTPAKKSGGVWDSLFQYEYSLQSGKRKS